MKFSVPLYRPECEVDFHSSRGFFSSRVSAGDIFVPGAVPTADLLSVNTTKTLSDTAGTFLMEFPLVKDANGLTWYDKVDPMDMVVIKLRRYPGDLHTVMVGFVDDVRRRKVISGGQTQHRVLISGKDFGKILIKAAIRYFPHWFSERSPLGDLLDPILRGLAFLSSGSVASGTPAKLIKMMIENVLDAVFDIDVQYWTGSSAARLGIKDILGYRLGKFHVTLSPEFDEALRGFEGAIWNNMQSVSMAPFMELFLDVRDTDEIMNNIHAPGGVEFDSYLRGGAGERYRFGNSKAVLFLRRTPFDRREWNVLKTHKIDPADVASEDIGKNDHQKYTAYSVFPETISPGHEQFNSLIPPKTTSIEEVKKYGLSVYDAQVRGLVYKRDMSGLENAYDVTRAMQDTLERWYRNNHRYENGTLTIKGLPEVHIGQRIEYDGKHFYVESVSHNFRRFGSYSTTLSVTRGQPADGRWLD